MSKFRQYLDDFTQCGVTQSGTEGAADRVTTLLSAGIVTATTAQSVFTFSDYMPSYGNNEMSRRMTKPTKYQMTCAPSEDSDQPGHRPSFIRVFAVHMKKHRALNYMYLLNADSDQTGRMPRLI